MLKGPTSSAWSARPSASRCSRIRSSAGNSPRWFARSKLLTPGWSRPPIRWTPWLRSRQTSCLVAPPLFSKCSAPRSWSTPSLFSLFQFSCRSIVFAGFTFYIHETLHETSWYNFGWSWIFPRCRTQRQLVDYPRNLKQQRGLACYLFRIMFNSCIEIWKHWNFVVKVLCEGGRANFWRLVLLSWRPGREGTLSNLVKIIVILRLDLLCVEDKYL